MFFTFTTEHNFKLNWYTYLEFVLNLPFNLIIYIYEKYSQQSYNPKRKPRRKGSPKRRRIMCQSVAVYASTLKAYRITPIDTDSCTIGIDNRASGCFSHVATDFVGPLRDSNRVVKGFGGSHTSSVKIGTLKWTWLDDDGKSWTHYIPNSYYCQSGGVRLLSPQHFAQQTGDLLGYENIHKWQAHNPTLESKIRQPNSSPITYGQCCHISYGSRIRTVHHILPTG